MKLTSDKMLIIVGTLLLFLGLSPMAFAPAPLVPSTTVNVQVSGAWPGDCYFRVTLSNVPAGYQVANGVYLGWCVDEQHYITPGTVYSAKLYSSYDPSNPFPDPDWPKVNWILNNKKGTQYDIQDAIWYFIDGGGTPPGSDGKWLVNNAELNPGFVPGSGQVIAIVVDVQEPVGVADVQHIFFELRLPDGGGGVPEFGESIPVVASMAGALLLLIRGRLKK